MESDVLVTGMEVVVKIMGVMTLLSKEISRKIKTEHLSRCAGKGWGKLLFEEPKINLGMCGQQPKRSLVSGVGSQTPGEDRLKSN